MGYKPFSQELHAKHDPRARQAVARMLEKRGLIAYENPDRYGIDILVYRCTYKPYSVYGALVGRVETEVKACWKTEKFPYPTVHIPLRKAKFIGASRKCRTYFVLFNNLLTVSVWVPAAVVWSADRANVPNKYMDSEEFFDIPINQCVIRGLV